MAGTITASIVKDPSSPTNNILLGATGNVTLGADTTATGAMSIGGLTTLSASGIRMVNGSNTTNILAPSTAGTYTITMPASTGTVLIPGTASALTLGTAQNSTSGTSIDFTGIPSWAKRVIVLMSGVSVNGTSGYRIQVGTSSGIVSTGYLGAQGYTSAGSGTINFTAGFDIKVGGGTSAANVLHGRMTIENLTGNTWIMALTGGLSDQTAAPFGGGTIALSGVLDRVRITTGNGFDTFDAGSINIMYE